MPKGLNINIPISENVSRKTSMNNNSLSSMPKIKLISTAFTANSPTNTATTAGTAATGLEHTTPGSTVDMSKGKVKGRRKSRQSKTDSSSTSLPVIRTISLSRKKRPHDQIDPINVDNSIVSTNTNGISETGKETKTIKLSLPSLRIVDVLGGNLASTGNTPPAKKPKLTSPIKPVLTIGKPALPTLPKIKVTVSPALQHTKPSFPTPNLKIKHLGKLPTRPHGEGYDSEDEETEIDPAIEQQFIFRMLPGSDLDYLSRAVSEKRIGINDPAQRANFTLRFFTTDGRRAVVNIQGHLYAASLVDFPCIIEGYKSWDKKNIYKSADICQLLLVLGPVSTEDQARDYPLPRDVDPKTWAYRHGLTPPMQSARERRFRKRIRYHSVEELELTVEKLMEADKLAQQSGGRSEYQIIYENNLEDDDTVDRFNESVMNVSEDMNDDTLNMCEDAIAEGMDQETLQRLQAAFLSDEDEPTNKTATKAINTNQERKDGNFEVGKNNCDVTSDTPRRDSQDSIFNADSFLSPSAMEVGTEVNLDESHNRESQEHRRSGRDYDDDNDNDDDDDEDEDDEEDEDESDNALRRVDDEDAFARHNALLELQEQIAEIKSDLESKQKQLEHQANRLLRNRLIAAIEKLEQNLKSKQHEYQALVDDKTR